MNRSLHFRITVSAAIVVGTAIIGFGIGVSFHLYRDCVADLEKNIRSDAELCFKNLPEAVAQEHRHDPAWVARLFPSPKEAYYFEIWRADHLLLRSPNLKGARFESKNWAPGFRNAWVDAEPVRLGVFERNGTTVKIASTLSEAIEIREDLFLSYLLALPVVIILAGGGCWWLARQALRPVKDITAAAERITAERLAERLPIPPGDDEIGHLTLVLNHMFDRLEKGFLQATRFTADASHELRTPLTIIRAELEANLRCPETPPAQKQVFANLQEETNRLQRIIDSLLLLSRADAEKLDLKRSRFDLSTFLAEFVDDYEVLAAANGIALKAQLASGAIVNADTQLLKQAVGNLLENAVKYNEPEGRLAVELSVQNAQATLRITNSGPGISPEDIPNLFQRFYRADRQARRTGHGLGLSLSREIAKAHGGDVELLESRNGFTTFALRLPVALMENDRVVMDASAVL